MGLTHRGGVQGDGPGLIIDAMEDVARARAWRSVERATVRQGDGNCYKAAITLILRAHELGLVNAAVVQAMAVLTRDDEGRPGRAPYEHAWVEADGPEGRVAYDFSFGARRSNDGRGLVLPAAEHRARLYAYAVHEYPAERALALRARRGHDGPWRRAPRVVIP